MNSHSSSNPGKFDPGSAVPVECHSDAGRPTLIFTRELSHSPQRVWNALTDPGEQKQWAPYISDRNLNALGPVILHMNEGPAEHDSPAKVLRAIPPTLLEFTWGDDVLTWELTPVATGTHLKLSHVSKALDWIPKLAAGWHICVEVMDRFLEGRPVGPIVGMNAMNYGWKSLNDQYAKQLGIANTGAPAGMDS